MRFSFNIYIVFTVFFSSTVIAEFKQSEPRITNGVPATRAQFPYQVSLQIKNSHFCGGSIIDKKHVVTAAHCVHGIDKNLARVWSGGTILNQKGIYSPIKYIFKHENYNPNTTDYDIAVLRLKEPFIFDNFTKPIALPTGKVSDNVSCNVSGWGYPHVNYTVISKKLLYAPVNVQNWTKCQKVYKGLTKRMICAGDKKGHDSCQGDSRGPLVCKVNSTDNYTSLVGVVSFGYSCGSPLHPGVYTNVIEFVNWIQIQQTRSLANINEIQVCALVAASVLYIAIY